MTRKRKAPPTKRRWIPLLPAERIPRTPQKIEALWEAGRRMGFNDEQIQRTLDDEDGLVMWKNDRYTVTVRERDGHVISICVRRNDRGTDVPWRHLQRIKTEIAGAEAEAIELFPAESRLVDTANQRWLWCLPPGEKIPVGFDEGRHVTGPEEASPIGARQAPLEEEA